jgi:hypothetical protein
VKLSDCSYESIKEAANSWEKFLHPETLRANLLAISLFVAAFEKFKECVIEKPEAFFCDGFNKNGFIISERYKTEVLPRSKSPLHASLLWFKEMGAIDDSDIQAFDEIKSHRNEVIHELMDFLVDANRNFDPAKFKALVDLFGKIEKWWLINFEMAIDPEFLPDGATPEDVIPGVLMSLQLMLDIASGNEPQEGYYYKALKEKTKGLAR